MTFRQLQPHWHELRCNNIDCNKLIGFVFQKYYGKHKYLCRDCYLLTFTETGDKN